MFETKESDVKIILFIVATAASYLDQGAETVYAIIKHLSPNFAIEYAATMTLASMLKEVQGQVDKESQHAS